MSEVLEERAGGTAAHELLLGLLRKSPAARLDINDVLKSPFLGRGAASIRTLQDSVQVIQRTTTNNWSASSASAISIGLNLHYVLL